MKNFEHLRFDVSNQAEVKFKIVPNLKAGQKVTYRIIDNYDDKENQIIRSPFDTHEEARQRQLDIAEYWGFKAIEI